MGFDNIVGNFRRDRGRAHIDVVMCAIEKESQNILWIESTLYSQTKPQCINETPHTLKAQSTILPELEQKNTRWVHFQVQKSTIGRLLRKTVPFTLKLDTIQTNCVHNTSVFMCQH